MTIDTRYGALSGNSIASSPSLPADADGYSDRMAPAPVTISPQPSPWRAQGGQASATISASTQTPPAYDPLATYRSGDTVSMRGNVYTLALAPGAPKVKGIAPDAYTSFGASPWWYQGKLANFHAPWSNSAIGTPASAGASNAAVDESANAHPNIRVTVRGNNIAIELPVQFSGSGLTPQRQAAMTDAIQKAWSGHFGPYEVSTSVTAPPPNAPAADINTITVLDQPGYSATDKNSVTLYTSEPGQSAYSGTQLGFVAAHEAGHLMGEPDHYALTDTNGIAGHDADPGYEHNIMGEKGGMVDQRNIESILRRTT